jgi:hypothetical protein
MATLLDTTRWRSNRLEASAIAVALVAVGMFVGNWVIGPAISTEAFDHSPLPSAKHQRVLLDQMAARPDPNPYRTPTPTFDLGDAPQYGAAARAQARAAIGGNRVSRNDREFPETGQDAFAAFDNAPAEPAPPVRSYYRKVDRHTIF